MNPKKRLGEMLIEAGIIGETQLKAALGHQRQWGVRLGQALVDLKLATEADIVSALSVKFGFPIAQLGELEPYALEQALGLVPRDFAVRHNVFPMAADTASLTVAMSDPTNLSVTDEIQFRTGRRVKVCMGGDREVADAVRRHYPAGEGEVEAIALDLDVDEGQSEAVFDPFGGGSKDALEAFFGHQPDGVGVRAAPTPAPAAPAPPAAPPPAAATPAPAASGPARPRPGDRPTPPAPAAKAAPAGPQRGATAAAIATPPPAAAPAPRARGPAPAPAPRARGPAAAPARTAPPAGPAPGSRPAVAPTPVARTPPPAAVPAPRGPAPASRSVAPVELDLEGAAGASPGGGGPVDLAPADLAPFPEATESDPILATDLAPADDAGVAERPLTPEELAILDALERLADGHHAEPEIVKPAQAMAALVRLLLRKRIITEQEFLDEFKRR